MVVCQSNNGTDAEYLPVSVMEYHNVYVYNAQDLILPYGISIACAVLCVAIGVWALLRTGATYSNRFSTILRTTRGPCFDHLVDLSPAAKKDCEGGIGAGERVPQESTTLLNHS